MNLQDMNLQDMNPLSDELPSHMAADNPYWPNISAIERSKDLDADLHPPVVDGAKWILSQHDVECLTAGAGILASGGGGDPKKGYTRAIKLLARNKITVYNPCRLDAEKQGLACTIALMGDPKKNVVDGNDGSMSALHHIQKALASKGRYSASEDDGCYLAKSEDIDKISLDNVELKNRVTALFPVETGGINIVQPLLVSCESELPCLDAAGQGRSYPELQMFMPFIYDSCYCPAVLGFPKKKRNVICVGADTCEHMEECFRKKSTKQLHSLAMGPIPFEAVFQTLVLFAMSQAWRLGRAVARAMKTGSSVLDTIVDQQHGYVLITGKITHVDLQGDDGFDKNVTIVDGSDEYEGYTLKISAKNENYAAEKVNSEGKVEEILASIPDLIVIVDLETSNLLEVAVMAMSTENFKEKKVGVVVLPADPRLYTERALQVVGPRGLGLDYDYQEPKFLKKCY